MNQSHAQRPQRALSSRGRLHATVLLCALAIMFSGTAAFGNGDFLLIRRSMQMQTIKLATISERYVEHLPPNNSWERVPLDECIALLNPAAVMKPRTTGLLVLADGQRLPGEAAIGESANAQTIAWNHAWLGRMEVPLKLLASVLFTPTALSPPPGAEDVILLANGDRQEGLIAAWGDSITLETGRGAQQQIIDIPLNVIESISMVAARQPVSAAAKRLWFDDGTVIDAQSVSVGEDGFVRLNGSMLVGGTQPTQIGLKQIAAILLDPHGVTPLATIAPARVDGPPTRYQILRPTILDPDAPLGLSSIEFQGPVVVRYALPASVQRFTAEAELPPTAKQWGDYELVIRSNDSEVFRTRLNAANPVATINTALTGRELTIELTEGESGPVQDRLVLRRPMLLMRR